MNLDYSIKTVSGRTELVKKIIEETPKENLTQGYLTILANYIIDSCDSKKEILTDNRLVTINKRETSFEGLVSKLENGQDGVYGLLSDLGKNTILSPKMGITEEDLENHESLRSLKDTISEWEEMCKTAKGKERYIIKKQIIEMRKEQYAIKNSNTVLSSSTKSFDKIKFEDKIYIDENGIPQNDGAFSMFKEEHISTLLCNYSKLKEEAYGNFSSDLWYLLEDLDKLIEETLKEKHPLYYDLLKYKIDGLLNAAIQEKLEASYGVRHSVEYISSLWRKKIPKLLAEKAQEQYLIWHYTYEERGHWKKCSRCGETKLAHQFFFSKNKSSKDGWYSICKECRNRKRGK